MNLNGIELTRLDNQSNMDISMMCPRSVEVAAQNPGCAWFRAKNSGSMPGGRMIQAGDCLLVKPNGADCVPLWHFGSL